MRRHVFFIAGFDPKSPRYYHALYRREARRQALVSGLHVEVDTTRSRPAPHSSAWALRSGPVAGSSEAQTTFELLQWDDIVRAHWSPSPWRVLVDGSHSVLFGLRDGAVQRMFRLFRPPVFAVFFPLAVMLLSVGMALGVGIAVGAGLMAPMARIFHMTDAAQPDWPRWLTSGVGAAVTLALLWLALVLLHRLQMTWLLRLVRFSHLHARGDVPELDQRLAAFGERIAAVLCKPHPPDEVLVVGHSAGATLALQALAHALDRPAQAGGQQTPAHDSIRPALALLSLGHCIPLTSSLSPAHALRSALQRVANSGVTWLDVSSPIDWAAFPGVDPVTAAGLPPAPHGWHPRLLSPQFHRLFGAPAYARLKRNRFQVHLQYLRAAELPGRFDYFAITAGALTLRQRFAESPEPHEPSPE